MATEDEVERFIGEFRVKSRVFGMVFRDDRNKNLETMAELGISRVEREKIVRSVEVEDYSEGPIEDLLNRISALWVFGKFVRNRELYIKISMGYPGCSTICVSFHFAEHPMKYPFKRKEGSL